MYIPLFQIVIQYRQPSIRSGIFAEPLASSSLAIAMQQHFICDLLLSEARVHFRLEANKGIADLVAILMNERGASSLFSSRQPMHGAGTVNLCALASHLEMPITFCIPTETTTTYTLSRERGLQKQFKRGNLTAVSLATQRANSEAPCHLVRGRNCRQDCEAEIGARSHTCSTDASLLPFSLVSGRCAALVHFARAQPNLEKTSSPLHHRAHRHTLTLTHAHTHTLSFSPLLEQGRL